MNLFLGDLNLITFDLKSPPQFQFMRVLITGSDVSQCKPRGVDITGQMLTVGLKPRIPRTFSSPFLNPNSLNCGSRNK